MSLQSSTELARTGEPIIDPRTLTIEALYVSGAHIMTEPSVLHIQDIREASSLGYIIDDAEKIMSLDDLVRLQEIIEFKFSLINNQVVDETGQHIGKVYDYTYEPSSFEVQQIYVKPPLLKSFSEPTVIIHRQQIISVTNKQIIVKAPTIKVADEKPAKQPLVNPFRTQSQPEVESFKAD